MVTSSIQTDALVPCLHEVEKTAGGDGRILGVTRRRVDTMGGER